LTALIDMEQTCFDFSLLDAMIRTSEVARVTPSDRVRGRLKPFPRRILAARKRERSII